MCNEDRYFGGKYYHYIQYLLFFVFTFILSWTCLNPAVSQFLPKIPIIISDCEKKSSIYCYGVTTIYRANFGLSLFYLIHLLVLTVFKRWFQGCYTVRWLIFLIIGALSMMLPNFVITLYILVAFCGAVIFLALNIATFIDFSGQIEQSVRRNKHYIRNILVNLVTWVLIIVNIGLFIVSIVFFPCLTARTITMINFILTGLTYGLCFGLPGGRDRSSLLACSVLSVYNSYIVWSSLNNGLGLTGSCYLLSRDLDSQFDLGIVIDSLVTVVTIIWTAFSIANYHNFINLTASQYSQNIFYIREAIDEAQNIEARDADVHDTEAQNLEAGFKQADFGSVDASEGFLMNCYRDEIKFWLNIQQMRVFFIVMILATCSMLASMSSWQFYNGEHSVRIDTGITGMWIKICSTILTYIIYIGVTLWNRWRGEGFVGVRLFDIDG